MKSFLFAATFAFTSLFAFNSSDQQEINNAIQGMTNAWNEHQGHGFADGYAQQAEFVNIFGMPFSGKEQIEMRHIAILETFLKDSKFIVQDIKLREVKPEVVIAWVSWQLINPIMKGVFTHVFVKNDGKWEITASQNTLKKE